MRMTRKEELQVILVISERIVKIRTVESPL